MDATLFNSGFEPRIINLKSYAYDKSNVVYFIETVVLLGMLR
jgi:hypothetical protein